MARYLLLSNGHGEDLSGALIGKALKGLGNQVEALPIVGLGNAYKAAGIGVIGEAKEFSTGGLGYTSLKGRIKEVIQGQIFYLLKRLLLLLRLANYYDLIVVIGDVIPVFAAWLSGRPAVTYLVAYSSHYEGKLQLPWPCGLCLKNRRFLGLFTRDQLTAKDLSKQLNRSVLFLGNPFMDPVLTPQSQLPSCKLRLGLLPGSRRPELDSNLLAIMHVISLLPKPFIVNQGLSLDIALVSALNDNELEELIKGSNWELKRPSGILKTTQLIKSPFKINVLRDSFIKVLQSSDVLLSMAGTAAEQAIGLAKPVIQLIGNGPQFTYTFAEAQRRLLGPTIFCVDGTPFKSYTMHKTAALIIELLKRSKEDIRLQKACQFQAEKRIGTRGGSQYIAEAISQLLSQKQKKESPPSDRKN